MFQFQTGSIKREFSEFGDAEKHRFNSKLVRLKVDGWADATTSSNGFNSKLVRLKVPLSGWVLLTDFKFQFQTGSIKRLNY